MIGRLLEDLQGLPPEVEVLVVCNGCSDGTAAVANRCRGRLTLRVFSMPRASKAQALNEGDRMADTFPRVYLDADVRVPASSVTAVIADLAAGNHLAGRPPLAYDSSEGDALVRSFYRAGSRVPYLMGAPWGAGFYAVSEVGRARWGVFPESTADDYFVATRFTTAEFGVVETDPVVVATPKTTRALVRTLHRVYTLPPRTGGSYTAGSRSTLRALLRASAGSSRSALDVLVYVGIVLVSRLPTGRRKAKAWARDETQRQA